MNLIKRLSKFGNVPFSRGAMLSILGEYRRPNDKIAQLMDQGVLLPLKKGLYVLGEDYRPGSVSLPLMANLLYGPSYVSADSALAWHGLIPEGVFGVTSITSRRSKNYDTPFGRFAYLHVPQEVFRIGIQMEAADDGTAFLMAGPEKALCDKILVTRNLRLGSLQALASFLEEDLRVDIDMLLGWNLAIVDQYKSCGHKVAILTLLRKFLEDINVGR
ncbi:Transcriptional regulator, AbiEi antitoxin, Type IV TA system [Marinobacter sp. LV10R510-11A]|uniref:type IV toxin-antitoxin system AbiEi family antitoxin domain-containing protein n=1 Tax=Marinobacter sp. LV10R510-11A TaxID=1415568 RepID=UPI000BBFA18C|nr:hypothetical protein [Marinobacter sp. LV10R510-11A]SOB74566.1 Transcriptional regulator, AbiEi antitoxin, Type IV TA system [Marinobacter sp. LV10R510-11A]